MDQSQKTIGVQPFAIALLVRNYLLGQPERRQGHAPRRMIAAHPDIPLGRCSQLNCAHLLHSGGDGGHDDGR